jgi:hypothetical protein
MSLKLSLEKTMKSMFAVMMTLGFALCASSNNAEAGCFSRRSCCEPVSCCTPAPTTCCAPAPAPACCAPAPNQLRLAVLQLRPAVHQPQPAVLQPQHAVKLQHVVQNQFAAVQFDAVVCECHVSDAAASLSATAATKPDCTEQEFCAVQFHPARCCSGKIKLQTTQPVY